MQILGVQVRERGLGLVCGEADFVMCKESKAEKQKFPLGSGQWADREKVPGSHLHFRWIPLSLASGRNREVRLKAGG